MVPDTRAELTTKELIEITLATGTVILLAWIFYAFISPDFDVADETAKSFFNQFEDQLESIDEDGFGELLIREFDTNDEISYAFVYFDDLVLYEGYRSVGDHTNHICICSSDEGRKVCNHCKDLELPIFFEDSSSQFTIASNQRIAVIKQEAWYEFRIFE